MRIVELGLIVVLAAVPALAAADIPVVGAAEVQAALGDGRTVVVDVRTAAEYAKAHVPGAVNVPAAEVVGLVGAPAGAGRLPREHGTPLIFYCRGFG